MEANKDVDFLNPNANTGIELRFFASDVEKERVAKMQAFRHPHIRPGSTLVAPMGVMWEPGCYQKVVDMVVKTNENGVCCWLHEVPDINAGIPYTHLNMMRDTACMYAHDAGFEYVLLLENDAYPEPNMLLRLLNWDMPVVVPYIVDEVLGKPICSPFFDKGIGLQPIQWSVFTCMLINTRVLNVFPFCQPFGEVKIESGFYSKLRHYGIKSYIDTNTELKLTKRPAYPVDMNGLENEWKQWVNIDQKRRQIPDRRPIDPDDKRQVNGIYMPVGLNIDAQGVKGGKDEKETTGTGKKENGNGVPTSPRPQNRAARRAKKHKS